VETYTPDSSRCNRYDQVHPVSMNISTYDPRLGAGEHVFHNAACSGSSTADVEAYQLEDEDTSGKTSWQFGPRYHVFP